ncbi:MAG: AHH domain-containing protein [Erythrobacter sp.]
MQLRTPIPFRAVNCRGSSDYDRSLQRHHLLPRQLLQRRCFGKMFTEIGRSRVGFDDFRFNGLLLPANEDATIRTGMPLHRGPHRHYNEMALERVGCIESTWSQLRTTDPITAARDAVFRIRLVQTGLRLRLLDVRDRLILNKKDPLGTGFDFTELDAMAEALWAST